jgi:hypothetical protein
MGTSSGVLHNMTEAFAGIDVAFAKRKLLPVSVCRWVNNQFVPLPLRKAKSIPPHGYGNAATHNFEKVWFFADSTARYLRAVEIEFGVRIRRIAIDAPSDPKEPGLPRRRAEQALDARQIRCITTPSFSEFIRIKQKASDHLASGGLESNIPHANQLWMIIGFALFTRLRQEWECLEVFPQATAAILNSAAKHKTTAAGLNTQLRSIVRFTRWPEVPEASALRQIGHGSLHDCLDAYSAAWIASLGDSERLPLGELPNDVIWVPLVSDGA